ncbi:hypothetical protein MLD38_006800 [Melastoma candidum]|uniref:Uncharacterized protein n=1 Tax=Melastoma candidum TaxID=119954 RepID=A0ACB9RXI5_9MYRT|nr:hypothetical protein MLD38_006800 [Melastoma candidum]
MPPLNRKQKHCDSSSHTATAAATLRRRGVPGDSDEEGPLPLLHHTTGDPGLISGDTTVFCECLHHCCEGTLFLIAAPDPASRRRLPEARTTTKSSLLTTADPWFQPYLQRAPTPSPVVQIRRRRINVPSGVPSSRDVFGSDSGDSTSSSDVTSNLSVPPPPVQHQVPEERQRRRRRSDPIPAIGESAFKTHAPSSGRETQNPRPSGVFGSGGFKSQHIPALRVASAFGSTSFQSLSPLPNED